MADEAELRRPRLHTLLSFYHEINYSELKVTASW